MANPRGIRAGAAYIELFVNDSRLVRGLQNASAKLKAFGSAIQGWGKTLATVGTAITAPLLASTKVFSAMGDQVAKMSQRVGISVETLSELGYVASLSGADLETLEKGLRKMQKSIVDAAQGTQTAVEALELLGLSVEDFRGKSPDQQFKLIADRMKGIKSPAVKSAAAMELFGRAGTQLIPMMNEGSRGIQALQEQARKLGLTMSSEDAQAAELLNDTFDTLWKVLKQGVFVIGSALAPTIRSVSEWIINTVVQTTRWIKENKDLVVTIFKVTAAVVAGGLALIALGYAITTLGTIIGGMAAVLTTIGAAIGVLGSILAWLLTPIGAVTAAVVALGGYLVYASGAGGKALQWLADRFGDLSAFATDSFRGISDALMAGDIALAAKILWLSLKLLWQSGVLELLRVWEWLRTGAIQKVNNLVYGVLAAWEIGTHEVISLALKLYYGVMDIWTRLSTGVMNVWDSAINWVARRIVDLWGLIDDSLDPRKMKEQLDAEATLTINKRNQAKDTEVNRLAQDRDKALARQQKKFEDNMNAISDADRYSRNKLSKESQAKIDAAQGELDAAKKEWQDAIAEARRKRELRDAQGPDRLREPQEIADYLQGLGPRIQEARDKTIGVAGTFNAMEARGLGAGGVADRIARASEETAKNTKKLVDLGRQDDGQEFE